MASILRLRQHLADAIQRHPELEAVDFDFNHLLSSWFNPGFLRLKRMTWQAPAELLERIVRHERVHEIRDWKDLRHRLQADRRCFAFFHPALEDEPLIFVEVALVDEMPEAIAPLLDIRRAATDPGEARVATFYSISNSQPGLRGVSLGDFLIKEVVEHLSTEFPRLRRFCTLSPIPLFASWALKRASQPVSGTIREVLKDREPELALRKLETIKSELLPLCARYFLERTVGGDQTVDPVARFHLSNGARLERINWRANVSLRGIRESLGIMVNYLYDPVRIERNHDAFHRERVVASPAVRGLLTEGARRTRTARR